MRPVMEGLIGYDKLIDGTVSIEDIARMNDALDIREINQARLDKRLRQ
jgi:Family of unknown function (DUF6889)